VGTADGMMLNRLNLNLDLDRAVGIDTSFVLLSANRDSAINLLQGKGEELPFKMETFDVIVAASVIDHLNDVDKFLSECYSVLEKKGLMIITVVTPFFDRMAVRAGLKENDHIQTYSSEELECLLGNHGFTILLRKKFALPSFGLFPREECLEKALRAVGLDSLMFYQLIVGEKRCGQR